MHMSGSAFAAAAPVQPQNSLLPLVDAAAQRLQAADPVAAAKYTTGGAIDDPKREQQVFDIVTKAAKANDIDPAYVVTVFRNQIDATSAVEHTRFAQWKLDPTSAPVAATDLAHSRTTIDSLNHSMVREIAAQWDVLHSPMCRSELNNALQNVVAARALDEVYQAALSYATHSYCTSSVHIVEEN
ncbi:chorismate mutase [Mycobacterium dioxanotrophicus]|uniref:Chorismate mutase n=1 Tax=Mycobacterium dioxanotrophicus TaxID=482462 RepID=A0A1Y0C4P9_9MYCO|nr:chorismate mutase [Mycobacterium dioxanotrophicus]ART70046.1 chorismate mutase [Mycobacterium dioxanotrophicus]